METDKELSNKDLIYEGIKKNPQPFWLWMALLSIIFVLIWGFYSWYIDTILIRISQSPFLQVTNRELSLFLWNNPEHMRVHSNRKAGYLTAFQYVNKVSMEPELAGQYVIAPPELLFQYHTWTRLIKDEMPIAPIASKEFKEFLDYAEEWQPRYWKDAPEGYVELVNNLPEGILTTLPQDVQIAFQGWRNYFKEGESINKSLYTYKQVRDFLNKHPHYARNYWRNLIGLHYLENLYLKKNEEIIPHSEMAPFLKVALFNSLKVEQ